MNIIDEVSVLVKKAEILGDDSFLRGRISPLEYPERSGRISPLEYPKLIRDKTVPSQTPTNVNTVTKQVATKGNAWPYSYLRKRKFLSDLVKQMKGNSAPDRQPYKTIDLNDILRSLGR